MHNMLYLPFQLHYVDQILLTIHQKGCINVVNILPITHENKGFLYHFVSIHEALRFARDFFIIGCAI
jgi:hypothetical protein